MGYVALTVSQKILCGCFASFFQFDPSTELFPHIVIMDSDYLNIRNVRMLHEKLFNLHRVDVFTTSDDHVF